MARNHTILIAAIVISVVVLSGLLFYSIKVNREIAERDFIDEDLIQRLVLNRQQKALDSKVGDPLSEENKLKQKEDLENVSKTIIPLTKEEIQRQSQELDELVNGK